MFNENNSVQQFITGILSNELGWRSVPGQALERSIRDVFLPGELKAALVRLNPDIAAQPERADEVLYRLNAILLAVGSDGLARANQAMMDWLRNDKTMPFGEKHQHVPIKLIDFDDLSQNTYIVAEEVTFKPARVEKRFDHVLYVNGIPLVVGEAKTPVDSRWSWFDGAYQVQGYEENVAPFFVPNVFSFATEGKVYRYGAVQMPLDLWGPWREDDDNERNHEGLKHVGQSVRAMLSPQVVLDMLKDFTTFAAKSGKTIKVIARYQQYHTVNKIVQRVVLGKTRKGLIWHFQGSGKSLLMVFAAQKLRANPMLKNPTVLIVVDRIDLDTQITGTFMATEVANVVTTDKRDELQRLLASGVRKIIITTIHKFAEANGVLNDGSNIIVMVDEAHRTQEGDLGRQMREALPNAFLFGLTGTPINKRDRNTFYAFGAEEDEHGYLDRYSFEDSIRDGATLPLKFEARLVELHVDQQAIDEAYAQISGHLSEEDQANLAKMAANMAVLVKSPSRVERIVKDIVHHYQAKVEPNGFKAMVVTFDREACLLYKTAIDRLLPPEASEIVMTVNSRMEVGYRPYDRSKDQEEAILDNFRNPDHPLKFLIVTAKLLTGFDAPILQAMYLDKPMKEHNLLQAICRTNRVYATATDEANKLYGLIVDYIGVFDDVAKSLRFDEGEMQRVVENIEALKAQFAPQVAKCLAYFPGVDRTVAGYEGLMAAQECLPDNDARDAFAAEYLVLALLWEALSPDPSLMRHKHDYRWLSQVYESVKPTSGHGKLIWHALGAKTLDLIHENVSVLDVRDDLDTLVMDAEFLAELLEQQHPKAIKELEIKLVARLRKHGNNVRFVALGMQLEELRRRHEQGVITSIEFLKMLLKVARDVVRAEKEVEPVVEVAPEDQGIAALTELFREIQNGDTPKMVERIVMDIDEIVRIVRFPGWQNTNKGEREVKMALRKTLAKYQLHKDNDLFDRAYGYIAEYY
ncbi:MAG: HsdR family type I site-specific deoxyribonuclease [Anaerolineae bacterium]|nr:HsdR family type I site-specific deoxyribonuclease [Anaerolineae bacterium]